MNTIRIDLSKTYGIIKPMHAVNNGPTAPNVRSTKKTSFDLYKKASFPYARNHDASFYGPYGGEHIVDVHRIFKNFDADENDPASYWFEPTDRYLKLTLDAGTKIFYRLGASIEHYFKYGTRVPKDFAKWARICEHIIMHYNEGWANGFHYNIEYWEIWNEPDCLNADGSNPCWQGTEEQFIDLYEVAAKHFKSRFPKLKIGGPAFCNWETTPFKTKFLNAVKERNIPLDFYSYHWYGNDLSYFEKMIINAQEELKSSGLDGTPTIINEWNYIRGWLNEEWDYSLKTEKNLKGASFISGVMCLAQANPLDMLMYYEARPCAMNGLFDEKTFKIQKPYYPFLMFSHLAKLGSYVKHENSIPDVYVCTAKNSDEAALMLTYYNDNDDGYHKDIPVAESSKEISLDISNVFDDGNTKIQYYLLDDEHNAELFKEEKFNGKSLKINLDMSLYSTYLIKIKKQ